MMTCKPNLSLRTEPVIKDWQANATDSGEIPLPPDSPKRAPRFKPIKMWLEERIVEINRYITTCMIEEKPTDIDAVKERNAHLERLEKL